MIGSGLALAGLGMQALTKNSLADPYVLGISSGASAGAVFVIMTGALAFLPGYRVMLGGFVGAVIAIILAVRCATIRKRMTAVQLVLAGVAVSSLFSAAVNVLIYTSSESSKQKTAMFWMIGSLAGANWTDVKILAVVFIPCLLIFFLIRKSLDVLLLGDDAAKTLGVNLGVLKLLIIIGSTLLAGSIVSWEIPLYRFRIFSFSDSLAVCSNAATSKVFQVRSIPYAVYEIIRQLKKEKQRQGVPSPVLPVSVIHAFIL